MTAEQEAQQMLDQIKQRCETVSIPFGPTGCPDARSELADLWSLPGMHETFFEVFGGSKQHAAIDKTATIASVQNTLLYWVSPEMCDLLNTAEVSVPLETSLLDELLPHAYGLVFMATTRLGCIDTVNPEDGRVHVDAFHWACGYTIRNNQPAPELIVHSYSYHGTPGGPTKWWPIGVSSWPRFTPIDYRRPGETDLELTSALEDRRLLISFLALIKSPGITQTVIQRPDRAAMRRAARKGITADNDVRVIYLRSPRGDGHIEGDGRKYDAHRWIVSGHWRSQPYGPGRVHRKPVWIAPHVKGPDGAPMLHGEKVRAVVR